MKIKIKIKEIRENKSLTLIELSEKTGISKSHLNYIERGIKEPTLSILIKIDKALEIEHIEELYEIN